MVTSNYQKVESIGECQSKFKVYSITDITHLTLCDDPNHCCTLALANYRHQKVILVWSELRVLSCSGDFKAAQAQRQSKTLNMREMLTEEWKKIEDNLDSCRYIHVIWVMLPQTNQFPGIYNLISRPTIKTTNKQCSGMVLLAFHYFEFKRN